MAPQSDSLPLASYAAMLWRRRVLVLIIALGMTVPAFVISASQTPQYEATAQILLTQHQLDDNLNVKDTALTDIQVSNQVAIINGPEVAKRAREQGGTSPFTAVSTSSSNVIKLTSLAPDPRQAEGTVEAYMRAFTEYRAEQVRKALASAANQLQSRIATLQEQINKLAPADRALLDTQQASVQANLGQVEIQQGLVTSGVEVVQDPTVEESPITPTPVRNSLFALVVGLVLAVSLAVLLETMRRATPAHSAAPNSGNLNGASPPAGHYLRSPAPVEPGRTSTPGQVADDST